jgi:hypothetical protein
MVYDIPTNRPKTFNKANKLLQNIQITFYLISIQIWKCYRIVNLKNKLQFKFDWHNSKHMTSER